MVPHLRFYFHENILLSKIKIKVYILHLILSLIDFLNWWERQQLKYYLICWSVCRLKVNIINCVCGLTCDFHIRSYSCSWNVALYLGETSRGHSIGDWSWDSGHDDEFAMQGGGRLCFLFIVFLCVVCWSSWTKLFFCWTIHQDNRHFERPAGDMFCEV